MFEVGQAVYIEGRSENGFATVAGYRPQRYLALDGRKMPWRPAKGEKLLTRLFYNGDIITHTAHSLGYLPEIGLLLLGNLARTAVKSNRREPRYFFTLPVQAHIGDEERYLTVKDVSAKGLQFVSAEPFEEERRLTFRFALGPRFGNVEMSGRLVRRGERGDHHSCGVLFDGIAEKEGAIWRRFLEELSRYEEFALPEPEEEPMVPVGQTLQLAIGMKTLTAHIRGYRNGAWLMTDIPAIKGVPVTAAADGMGEIEARVRFLREGVASAFKTVLFKQYTSPAPIWVWRYPEEVETADVRKNARFRTAIPAGIEWSDGNGFGMLVDVSHGGGRIAMVGEPPEQEEAVKVAFAFPDGNLSAGIIGDVRTVAPGEKVSYIGLSFRRERSPSYEALDHFLRMMEGNEAVTS